MADQRGADWLARFALAARIMIVVLLLVLFVQVLGSAFMLYAELMVGGGGTGTTYTFGDYGYVEEEVSLYSDWFAAALGGAAMFVGLFFLLAAVPILLWIRLAHARLRAAGLDELSYSPGWAVGSYFIPGVNFVVPFRAMRELHNRSHGEEPWQAHASVPDVSSWWSFHVAAVGVMFVALFVASLTMIPYLYVVQPPGVNTGLFIFALLLLAGSAAYLFRVIGAVTRAQRQGWHIAHADVFA